MSSEDPLTAARAELDRLREQVVWLQARVNELETAAAARAEPHDVRRGLASLIPGAAPRAG